MAEGVTVKCVSCSRFTFKTGGMEKTGFGRCEKKEPHEYVSPVFDRECDRFNSAGEDRAKAGMDYLNGIWKSRKVGENV